MSGGYGNQKEGYKAWKKLLRSDKASSKTVSDREAYYKKGFLPGQIENLDLSQDNYMDSISLKDYMQIIYGRNENLEILKEELYDVTELKELEDTTEKYSLYFYIRKHVGRVPTILDVYVYDREKSAFVERVDLNGCIKTACDYSLEDIDVAYEELALLVPENKGVGFTAIEFVKKDGKLQLNKVHTLPDYPFGIGFSDSTNAYLLDLRRGQIWRKKKRRGNKFMRKLCRLFFNFKRLRLVSRGFNAKRAEIWLLIKSVDRKMNEGEDSKLVKWAHKKGFTFRAIKKLGINENNVNEFISEEEYNKIMPLNLKYKKWIGNMATVYYVFKPFRKYMAEFYYHLMIRDGKTLFIPYENQKVSDDYKTDIKNLLDEKKSITVCNINGSPIIVLCKKDNKYFLGKKKAEFEDIWNYLTELTKEVLLMETMEDDGEGDQNKGGQRASKLTVSVFNRNGQGAKIGNAVLFEYNKYGQGNNHAIDITSGMLLGDDVDGRKIPNWKEIEEIIEKMGRHVPQLEFFAIEFILRGEQIQIKNLLNYPSYSIKYPFSKEVTAFLMEKAAEVNEFYKDRKNRRERGGDTGKRRVRKRFASLLYPRGLVPYLSVTWLRDMRQDFFSNKDCSFGKKMWAYRHGFLSYRLDQYGVTKENWENYIADFEYKWLRHINPYYKTWMEDKITIKYIANKYNQYFPEYYYHVICKNDEMNIIPLMDAGENAGKQISSIIDLVKEKKVLAFKPDEGSHGQGFFRCDYKDGKFLINYEEATEQDIIDRLSQNDSAYIITEYIQMHPQLKEIYAGSVNTVRMIVFKKDGIHPEIGNAYMRIGTAKTGAIDNMAAGGMFAAIDINTGRYGGAKIFVDGDIRDCERHPDTNVLIEGIMPNWELTKKLVLDIASEIQELEFFGFDLAITEDGIKIPEINRSPDYPKIEKYNRPTIDYLLYKLDKKKELFGYNEKPNRSIIHLPKRKKPIVY